MSRALPTPTAPNADSWCSGPVHILRAQNYDLPSTGMWARIFGPRAIGYHKEVTVECPATQEVRTIWKDYYFTTVPDADDCSVLRVRYENVTTVTDRLEENTK